MQLKDKTVIIAGASSGIGAAAALLFAKEGANLVLGARREKELMSIMGQINQSGGRAICLAGDVGDESYAKILVEMAENTYGDLHAALNNAGAMGDAVPIPDMSSGNWDAVLKTNLTSAFYAAKHQIPAMKRSGGGSIIFTSSFVGHTAAFPGMGAYAASKSGLIGLAQVLATEHGSEGIRANTLLPGGTKTAMAGDWDTNEELKGFYESIHALKRMAEPDEIAKAALFLASDDSSFVTGSAMIVDGGNSINKV
ncbi:MULTISPECIES: SDR family oxidoreductase [unclassified Ruegeria]|uniref:SDR family oxidoreductase n=1 Tax=unclassified Ruegeria TaxID=2625375 RepID=UPI0014896B50|nr:MULTISPECIES: SDR family oxidoreductase [unclassified Ruegeria]